MNAVDIPDVKGMINSIRIRPRVFLKRDSVVDLTVFLCGYCFGLDVADPAGFPHCGEQKMFNQWLAGHLGQTPHQEMEDRLLAESQGDEEKAFELFFTYWDAFAVQMLPKPI